WSNPVSLAVAHDLRSHSGARSCSRTCRAYCSAEIPRAVALAFRAGTSSSGSFIVRFMGIFSKLTCNRQYTGCRSGCLFLPFIKPLRAWAGHRTTMVPGVGGDADVLSPSPPNLATPFPTGRKSTAGRLGFFLPAGNSARIFLTPYLAYVLASGGAGKPPREKRRPGKISVLAKMCMKTQGLMQNLRNFREIASYSIKSVYRQGRVRGREKGGIKK